MIINFISFVVLQTVSAGESDNCNSENEVSKNEVIYNGRCVDFFNPKVCEEKGKRLYEEENGDVSCGCLEDKWISRNGKCYQEFTDELCEGNQIIKLKDFGFDYDCIDNPCEKGKAPHRYWTILNHKNYLNFVH